MITYPAAWVLAATLVMVGLTFIARAVPARRAAAAPAPTPLLRPIEALDKFEAHCAVERRPTLHVRFRAGSVMCLDCRTELAANSQPETQQEGSHA